MKVREAIERSRGRVWALCYRMTGVRSDADDLAQEAMARALERAAQAREEDATGWLLRVAASVCLDHLRRRKLERRVAELVDPLPGGSAGQPLAPDSAAVLREDLRFAVVVALQRLSPRQRAAIVLFDVCDRSLEEVAETLDTNPNAAKALIHRARVALADARVHLDVDVPADGAVVERLARAIEAGSVDAIADLLAPDVWGIVDGGGVVKTSGKPSFGKRAVSRQWRNAQRRIGVPVSADIALLNGEPAVVVRLVGAAEFVVAIVHLETRGGLVAAQRVNRDPKRIALAVG
jgi:RNA polymerase sigma-70 factor (ECF subfamily)